MYNNNDNTNNTNNYKDTLEYNLKYIKNILSNYFIDNNININDDEQINSKIKKYLLKYKKIIALVLIILLLIIGYNCDPYNIRNNNQIQTGGASNVVPVPEPAPPAPQAPPAAPAPPAPKKTFKEKVKNKIAKSSDKRQAGYDLKKEKAKKTIESAKAKAGEFKKKALSLKTYTGGIYNVGSDVANKFKNNADLIYQVFYAFAMFILICIVTVPALAFIVIGLICYVLLKDKIKAVKDL